jgi:hypothetical protein
MRSGRGGTFRGFHPVRLRSRPGLQPAGRASSTTSSGSFARFRPVPYGRMGAFKAYMARRGVAVYDGAQGAAALDKMGHPNAFGMFIVMRSQKNPSGPPVTGFVFRGEPSRAVVHHELWHRHEFVTRYGGDFNRWADASEGRRIFDRERYVHQRMTGTGDTRNARGAERWNSYGPRERMEQALYDEQNRVQEAMAQMEEIIGQLGSLGVRP